MLIFIKHHQPRLVANCLSHRVAVLTGIGCQTWRACRAWTWARRGVTNPPRGAGTTAISTPSASCSRTPAAAAMETTSPLLTSANNSARERPVYCALCSPAIYCPLSFRCRSALNTKGTSSFKCQAF